MQLGFPRPVDSQVPRELLLERGGVTLCGTSQAARATAFAIPELGVALDIGRLTPALAAQPVVLLSHAHLDHLAGVLAYLNLRARFHRDTPTRLYCPVAVAAALRRGLGILPGLESVATRIDLDAAIVGVEAGESVPIPGGTASAFAVDHTVPSLGWRLFRRGDERASVSYAADGSTAPFATDPAVLDARMAVVECTFVEPNRRVAARLSGHAHVADWLAIASSLTCDVLVLAHLPLLDAPALVRSVRPLASAFPGELVVWTTGE